MFRTIPMQLHVYLVLSMQSDTVWKRERGRGGRKQVHIELRNYQRPSTGKAPGMLFHLKNAFNTQIGWIDFCHTV